jgi:Uma2 family endonuclease
VSTTTPAQTLVPPAPLASPEVYRFTVDEYDRMARVLDDPRVELIDGYVVRKMAKNPPHFWTVDWIADAIRPLVPPGWCLRREGPVRIPQFDEPEPDLAIARGTRDDYRSRHPEASDVTLLMEVAESSLDRDRGEKQVAYSKGDVPIPVYWIVNLVDPQIEVYTDPGPGGYRSRRDFKPGQSVPVVIDGALVGQIAVSDILP